MTITENLRKRFVKDTGVPIKIFAEPYFSHFLELYDKQFDTKKKYTMFLKLLEKFSDEQAYFEEYNRIKDAAITYLAENPAMQYFCQQEDMNQFKPSYTNLPSNPVFKCTNIGKHFVSIDMRKGNFTALRHYNPEIVGNKECYEDFIGMFTDEEYFKSSKYIRQVIFGNQNPKRQTTYEKYLMGKVLERLVQTFEEFDMNNIAFFNTDELVIDVTPYFTAPDPIDMVYAIATIENLVDWASAEGISVRADWFKLRKIVGTEGYIREFELASAAKGVDFKCVTADEMPSVIRAYNNEPVQEDDMLFTHENRLARWVTPMNIKFVDTMEEAINGKEEI
ncbi:MAG: hypothetical protein IJ419_13040 [Agathobacter sp.]|nr:hypothetical protein [Agathobacter sp.]